jgi:signal transduction histidine kinase
VRSYTAAPLLTRRSRARNLTPLVVFGTSLLLTVLVTYVLTATSRAREESRFSSVVASAQDRIRTRLETYIALLRGTAALYAASESVDAEEFRAYVERLRIKESYPGIQGIGFSQRVPANQRDRFEAEQREVHPEFRIWPDSARAEYHAIEFLEPLDQANRTAIGYDMSTNPVRAEAMARARDQAEPALSGKVTLVQDVDGSDNQPGFLIYVPVYEWPEVPIDSAIRRNGLLGFVYAPFRARDLFRGIFGSEQNPRVRFRVYDDSVSEASLLHDSHPNETIVRPTLQSFDSLDVGGRIWRIEYHPNQSFLASAPPSYATAVASAGLLLSLVLFLATRAQARAQARAESSERARSRFLAAMSHELRTPLNAIMGYNDLLLANVYGPLSTEQENGINRSQQAARHLLELVNDVLDLSKIEAGKIEIATEPVVIPKLIDDLLTTIRPMVRAHGSELHVQCPDNLPTVRTDPRRVRQILLNLLSNAAKYGRGQPIQVNCKIALDGGVIIAVRDQGIGIAADDLPRIFEEFVQVESIPGQGTGLGLAISNRLARTLGAALDVESEVGKGSTFRLKLRPN